MGYTRGRRGDASQGRDGPVEVGADSHRAGRDQGAGLGRSDVRLDLPRLHWRLGARLQRLPVARKRRLRGACGSSEGYTWHRTYGALLRGWLGRHLENGPLGLANVVPEEHQDWSAGRPEGNQLKLTTHGTYRDLTETVKLTRRLPRLRSWVST